jgi:hypothetical protein
VVEPAFVKTVARTVAELTLGGGLRRYPAETYYGGGAWPVLTDSLGWYFVPAADLAARRPLPVGPGQPNHYGPFPLPSYRP